MRGTYVDLLRRNSHSYPYKGILHSRFYKDPVKEILHTIFYSSQRELADQYPGIFSLRSLQHRVKFLAVVTVANFYGF